MLSELMETWLIWALVLFAAGLIITLAEVILPSGGVLALTAIGCLLGSLACAYQLSGWAAVALLLIEGFCVPVVIILAFKVLPKTSVGKNLMLEPPPDESQSKPSTAMQPPWTENEYAALLRKEGVVVAPLRPSGTAEIDGKRFSVISDGQLIPQGSRVRVILVEGNRIVVERVGA
jgi:membrane-bound serine protease (ClpP class)